MAETSYVWSRLEQEKDFLERYFYGEKFPILEIHGEQCFEREVKFDNGHVYRLRVCITEGYPEKMPDLVVCESLEPMPNWSAGHETHTWQPKDGLLRICYYHPLCWKNDIEIFRIFNKGEEWLNAYEEYLVSGKPLIHYLEEMRPTEEELINYVMTHYLEEMRQSEEKLINYLMNHYLEERRATEEDIERRKEEGNQGVLAILRDCRLWGFLKFAAEWLFELLLRWRPGSSRSNAASDIIRFERLEGSNMRVIMPGHTFVVSPQITATKKMKGQGKKQQRTKKKRKKNRARKG